jgi:hypothetical protein
MLSRDRKSIEQARSIVRASKARRITNAGRRDHRQWLDANVLARTAFSTRHPVLLFWLSGGLSHGTYWSMYIRSTQYCVHSLRGTSQACQALVVSTSGFATRSQKNPIDGTGSIVDDHPAWPETLRRERSASRRLDVQQGLSFLHPPLGSKAILSNVETAEEGAVPKELRARASSSSAGRVVKRRRRERPRRGCWAARRSTPAET